MLNQRARSDPFALGFAAHGNGLARSRCPFPEAYVEARRWQAGWAHAAFRAAK